MKDPGGYAGEALRACGAVKPKRKSAKSPTARTLDLFRELGYEVGIVERYNHHTRTRHDLFGCIDLVAMPKQTTNPAYGALGIQACAGPSHAARLAKAKAEPRLRTWLAAGNRFAVISWRKGGARGKRKVWEHRREDVLLEDLV